MFIKTLIKKWANFRSYRKAVKDANNLRSKTFKKYLVIFYKGEFIAVSKQRIKQLYNEGSLKCNVREFEKRAVYTTK